MRYETYGTRARFSYRAVLIILTSHLVVIDFRQGRLSTAENRPTRSLTFAQPAHPNWNACLSRRRPRVRDPSLPTFTIAKPRSSPFAETRSLLFSSMYSTDTMI